MKIFNIGDRIRLIGDLGATGVVVERSGPRDFPEYTILLDRDKDYSGEGPYTHVAANIVEAEYPDEKADITLPQDGPFGKPRYTAGMPDGVECKDIWETQGWAESAYKSNILKYILRIDHKGQKLSDAKKIRDYAQALVDLLESK